MPPPALSSTAVAACAGRFQPLQHAHLALLEALLEEAATLIVLIGSAGQARAIDGPWTAAERRNMIAAALGPERMARVRILPVRDVRYADARWATAVAALIDAELAGMDARPVSRLVFAGSERRTAADYAQLFPQWDCRAPRLPRAFVPDLLTLLWASPAEALGSLLATHCPGPVAALLARAFATAAFADLRAEYRYIADYREAWRQAPFPPVFVTVDAVVVHSGHTLLVRRGRRPGQGLFALPGGFIDPAERLAEAVLRELQEETALAVAPDVLRAAWRRTVVFDDPYRSLRGRTITHAHHFDLGPTGPLPAVRGGDDAADAFWLPVSALDEARMFEDHYAMLQVMLDLP